MFSFFVWIDIRKKVYWKGILVRELTDKQKTIFFNANVTVVITIKHRKGKKTERIQPTLVILFPVQNVFLLYFPSWFLKQSKFLKS